MKNVLLILALAGLFTFEYSCNAKSEKAAKPELKTQQEKYSYMIGLDMGRTLKNLNAEIDRSALSLGVDDALLGRRPLMADTQIARVREAFVQELQNKKNASQKDSAEKKAEK